MDMSGEQVLNTLGVTDGKVLFEILPGWEKSWKGYDGEVFFLQEEFQKKCLQICSVKEQDIERILSTVRAIQKNEVLKRFALHAYYRFAVCPAPEEGLSDSMSMWPEPEIPGGESALFYHIVFNGAVPDILNAYRRKGVPEEIITETLHFGGRWDNVFKRVSAYSLSWSRQFLKAELFTLGRFQYRIGKNLHIGVLLKNRKTGHKVMVCGPRRLDTEGLLVIPGMEKETDLYAPFEESASAFRGFPVDPRGRVILQEYTFLREEWEVMLRNGDLIMDMHIPGGGNMTPALSLESFRRAFDFLPKIAPDLKRIISSHSWIFYSRYEDLLPEGNMAALMRQGYIHPWTSNGTDGLSFVFKNHSQYSTWKEFPHDTRLRRAMLSLLENGEVLRRGGFLLCEEDLPVFGTEYYRMNFDCKKTV